MDAGHPGDTCADAIPIDLSLGAAVVYGSTVGAKNDYTAQCGISAGTPGGDVVYTFNAEGQVAITLDGIDGGLTPALDLRRDGCLGTSVSCDSIPSAYSVSFNDQSPHQYTVLVDAITAANGGFRLNVMGAAVAPGDFCPVAIPLTLSADGGVTVSGDNSAMLKNPQGLISCVGSPSYDMVYGVTLPHAGTLNITLTESWGNLANGDLELWSGAECATATNVACKTFSGSSFSLNQAVTAGPYWVALSTRGTTNPGPFTLTLGLQ